MNRARLKPWITWLLPLLVLRAFVPMGFMLSSDSGALAITFCSSIAAPGPSDIHAAHHHHDAQASGHHHGSDAHERTICPFGLTGTAYISDVVVLEPSAPAQTCSIALADSDQPSLTPSQAEPIRGPPSLA